MRETIELGYSKHLLALGAAVILTSSTLFPVSFLQKAEAATINIATDTTWTNATIMQGDIVKVSNAATLTIIGTFDILGLLNVNSGSTLELTKGSLTKIAPSGGVTVTQVKPLRPVAMVQIRGLVDIMGGAFVEGFQINPNAIVNIHNGGTLQNSRQSGLDVFGALNIHNGGRLSEGTFRVSGTRVHENGVLNVNQGGAISVVNGGGVSSGGIVNVNQGGVITLHDGLPDEPNTLSVGGTTNVKSGGIVSGSQFSLFSIRNGNVNLEPGGKIDVARVSITLGGVFDVASNFIVREGLDIEQGDLNILPGGVLDMFGLFTIFPEGAVSNQGKINMKCGSSFEAQPGSTYIGNPLANACPFPSTHMSDTTESVGAKLSIGGSTIVGERVTATSQLKGDKIDQITLRLKKTGNPTGSAIIGVFGPGGALKQQFALKDVATLTTNFNDYTFTLGGGQLYTIVSGDRIGIKYAGGTVTTNFVSVMQDTKAANPFDGIRSYSQQFKAGVWSGPTSNDMYMVLKQTHG